MSQIDQDVPKMFSVPSDDFINEAASTADRLATS
jgi:hypothetical protein